MTSPVTQESKAASPRNNEDSGGVLRSALKVAFGTLSSRVLGLLREVAFAALFDRTITDAWIAAFRLPNLFRRLLGEGSLSVSFVPVFVEARIHDPEAGAGHASPRALALSNGFFTLLLCFLTTLTVLGLLFPEPVLRLLLDDGYVAQVEKFALTVRLARIMFGFVFLVSLYAYFMGILNALGIYGLPAMAPMLFNVAMIISTVIPTGWFPSPGDGLAWGVIVGGFLQMALLVPALARKGYLPRLSFAWNNKDIFKVLRNMAPGLVGLGLMQITTLVNMRFASELGEGPISWIAWADRLLELPLSLVSVSLGTALLPTLSGFWTRGEKEKMSDTMGFALRLNIFLCLGAAAGLFALAHPIIEVIFERGRFTPADTAATASVLQVWALVMIPTACVRVLAPSYYAVKNTWFPAVISGICLVVHLIIAPRLMAVYGLTGLNSSTLVSSGLNFLLLLSFYRLLIAPFDYGRLLFQFLKFLVPAAALVLVVQIYGPLREFLGNAYFMKIVSLTIAVVAGGAVYGLVSRLMKLQEWEASAERVVVRLMRRK